ncbi:sulfite exporter TauE/SafE family protein [Pandoraea sp. B-6]|uniref:sulfite exporter TauE/SafE family protein n=1 Tax=Pandoraea sp. B-6 TaxID=1204340 RepID=UPI000347C85C|nr:sulfite exporter TauE/SafE family protein [Pandoraea sp. B-6]
MIDLSYSAAGALTGFVVGLTGVGGGAIMTPILLLVFGVAPHTAVATDLWFAAITKLVGAPIHHRSGHVDWQVAKRLWIGSLPVSLVVALCVNMGGGASRLTG